MTRSTKFSRKTASRIFLCILLTVITVITITGCARYGGSSNPPDKETLFANIGEGDYDYVAKYLDKWDFPRFNRSKMLSVEKRVAQTSVINYPEASEHAALCAELFLNKYYDSTDLSDPEKVTDALLRAYFETSGDRYAKYRDAEEYLDYLNKTSGEFVGIGVVLLSDSEGVLITEVMEGSGADIAGVMAGDRLIAVDSTSLDGYDGDVTALISGESGTTVKLTLMRDGDQIEITVTRSKVVERSVDYEQRVLTYEKADGTPIYFSVGYVKITAFRMNTAEQFKEAIDALEEEGVQGLIFDVRDNPGGYLSTVIDMLDYLVPINTKLASYKYKGIADTVERASDPHTIDLPVTVLCNENTASAAEIFASALRDYRDINLLDVYLVGNTTFGKGVMQTAYTFEDGSAFQITAGHILPPLGVSYHEIGIEPHFKCAIREDGDSAEVDRQYDLAASELSKLIALYSNGLSKDELLDIINSSIENSGDNNYPYVADYLKSWNAPLFDINKLRSMQDHYVQRVGKLGNLRELAVETAMIFVEKYYSEINILDSQATTAAMVSAWVEALEDEWAAYRTPDQYKDFEAEISGKAVGIGASLDKETHKIIKVLKGADSYNKLKIGDELYAVDGIRYLYKTDTTFDNYDKIASLLTGEVGESVEVQVLRDGELLTFNIERRAVDLQTVFSYIDENKIGYVEIVSFKSTTEGQFKEAMAYLKSEGAVGYVFDLRSNTGGTLNAVVECISNLVEMNRTIVSFEYLNGEIRPAVVATSLNTIGMTPCVVLCNEYTTAAGELFCAALRDYDEMGIMNVTLVGKTTFGKGVMQETQKLSDGSAITLTVAYYYPPLGKGTSFDKVGVTPDYTVEGTDDQLNKAYELLLDATASDAAA